MTDEQAIKKYYEEMHAEENQCLVYELDENLELIRKTLFLTEEPVRELCQTLLGDRKNFIKLNRFGNQNDFWYVGENCMQAIDPRSGTTTEYSKRNKKPNYEKIFQDFQELQASLNNESSVDGDKESSDFSN